MWALKRRQLQHSKAPILVGPYTGEVGFEALYWLPFLARFRDQTGIDPQRLIPITRGGAAMLYECPAGFEVYAMRTPQQCRIENQLAFKRHGSIKQNVISDFDAGIIRDAAETLNLKHYHVLHPCWMYRLLAPFWQGLRGPSWLDAYVKYTQLGTPPLPEGMQLPDKFVAVRFYARPTFPLAPQTLDFARETIAQIASHVPVVLLDANFHVDDHLDMMPLKKLPPNVTKLSDLTDLKVDTNLAAQAAVLARSMAFVGTYGGLSQLALRFAKPVIGMVSDFKETAWGHRHLSEILASHYQVPFAVMRLGDLPFLQKALPTVTVPAGAGSSVAAVTVVQ